MLPKNLGVEYCVFKWPNDYWNEDWGPDIVKKISLINFDSFIFTIYGIQINPDGCIVAKGYDEGESIFKIREYMKNELHFLPQKQSGWAHVPLGRILEPIGESKFLKLKQLFYDFQDINIVSCSINSIEYVHEKQWYMEKKNILFSHKLINSNEK